MEKRAERAVALAAASIIILAVGATVFVDREAGGWSGALYLARLRYIHHVPPLAWPSDAFESEAWKDSPVASRYRFAKAMVAEPARIGRTVSEVAQTLGGDIPSNATRWLYPLKPCGLQNLWWVLVVEFKNGQVSEVRRDTAWLDP